MKTRIVLLLAASLAVSAAFAEPRSVALIVQNHCSGGVEPPLSQLADRLASKLTTPELSLDIPANSIGASQNTKPVGEKMPPESAKELAQSLGKEGVLIASVQRFTAKTLSDPTITAHRISVSMTLTLYDAVTGGSVCSASLDNMGKTLDDADAKTNTSLLFEEALLEAADKVAQKFLREYGRANWEPAPVKKVKVFFGCNVLGARVKIDGQSYGTCPMELDVTVGMHKLNVSYPPYYFDFEEEFAKFEVDGQTYKVVLQINELGEEQRNRALEYETKLVELNKSQLELEKIKADNSVDYEKKKLSLEREKRSIEAERKERCALFKKQLELADAMLDRYELSGEADDYVRKTIAKGTAVYWKNSFGRIAITDGSADNIEFATPSTDAGDLAVPPSPKDIGEGLQKLLMKRIGH